MKDKNKVGKLSLKFITQGNKTKIPNLRTSVIFLASSIGVRLEKIP